MERQNIGTGNGIAAIVGRKKETLKSYNMKAKRRGEMKTIGITLLCLSGLIFTSGPALLSCLDEKKANILVCVLISLFWIFIIIGLRCLSQGHSLPIELF